MDFITIAQNVGFPIGCVATLVASNMDFINIVQNVGFPIGCVAFLAVYVKDLTKSHREEVNQLTEKLSEQTLTIQTLVDKIDELLRGEKNEN